MTTFCAGADFDLYHFLMQWWSLTVTDFFAVAEFDYDPFCAVAEFDHNHVFWQWRSLTGATFFTQRWSLTTTTFF